VERRWRRYTYGGGWQQRRMRGISSMLDPTATHIGASLPTNQYHEQVRAAQREALYPELLTGTDSASTSALLYRERRQSGLITVLLYHGALSPAQRLALAEFRLHQFVLCGWYDAERVATDQLTGDPAFHVLPPATIHAVVGLSDGCCLAYTCLQPAGESVSSVTLDQLVDAPAAQDSVGPQQAHHYFADADRALFPTERELFGPHVYDTLPALRTIPIEHVREWACWFRNQAVRSPLEIPALVAAFTRPMQYVAEPQHEIDIVVGHYNQTARKVYAALGLPVLYAPLAPVQPPTEDGYWTQGVNQQGAFWPGAFARADLMEHLVVIRQLDAALDLAPKDLRRTLAAALRNAEHRTGAPPPHALLPLSDPQTLFWTTDRYFNDSYRDLMAGLLAADVETPTALAARNGHNKTSNLVPSSATGNGSPQEEIRAGQSSGIRVQQVRTARDLRTWISFPRRVVYRRSSLWAAPLESDIRRQISPKHNPYFKHGRGVGFLARNARGRVVGRIFAHVSDRYNVRHGERAAWFGFLECIEDPAVTRALIEAAAVYGADLGCTILRGPVSLTAIEQLGVVLDHFDEEPSTDTIYTAPYYPALLDAAGLQRSYPMATFRVDSIAQIDPEAPLAERHRALLSAGRLRIRSLRVHDLDREIEIVRELINDAFYDEPFFVPLTQDEYRFIVQSYLKWLDPSLVLIAELDSVPVAFVLGVPDFYPVLKRLRGRVGPWAMLRFGLGGRPRVPDAVGTLMGVQRQLEGQGIARLLVAEFVRAVQRGGYKRLTITWAADVNERSLAATRPLGGRVLQHLCLYEADLPLQPKPAVEQATAYADTTDLVSTIAGGNDRAD
jgi:GNAT superfamily N-acetyltransferase